MQFVSDRALPTLLVGTKADKLGASERNLARGRLAQAVGASARDVLITSASTGVGLRGSDGLAQDLAMLVQDEAPA
jgi:GTP-binding protein EngB required for normal cell division